MFTQYGLLFGFGVLNIANVVFALASAVQVMAHISLKLTIVCFLNLPLLVLLTRMMERSMFQRMRDNQEAIGSLSSMLQGNLSGIRVVRSFALEQQEFAL